jgi:hypothetical protein
VPVIGYFIIFNDYIIRYLPLNASFCGGDGCSVTWRIYFLYFGMTFFAIGTAIYAWRCPKLVKRFGTAQEFFEVSKAFYSHPQTLKLILDEIFELQGTEYDDPLYFRDNIVNRRASVSESQLHTLAGPLFRFYVLKEQTYPFYRLAVYLLYVAGGVLVLIPSVLTFIDVLRNFLARM